MDFENLMNEGKEINDKGFNDIPEMPERLSSMVAEVGDFIDTIREKIAELFGTNSDVSAENYGIEECSEAVQDVMTDEIINEWPNFTPEQRAEILNDCAEKISETLGINIQDLSFEDMDASSRGYATPDGAIVLNVDTLYDPSLLADALDTVAHESRHQLQYAAIENPDNFDIPADVIDTWRDNMNNYISPEWDFEGYTKQPVEEDARNFAAGVITNVLG